MPSRKRQQAVRVRPDGDGAADRGQRLQTLVDDLERLLRKEDSLETLLPTVAEQTAVALGHDVCEIRELSSDGRLLSRGARGHVGSREASEGAAAASDEQALDAHRLTALRGDGPVIMKGADAADGASPSGRSEGSADGPEESTTRVSIAIGPADERWGLLTCQSLRPHVYDRAERECLKSVARLIGDSVARRRKDRTIREQLAELNACYRMEPVGLSFQERDLRFLRVNDRDMTGVGGPPTVETFGQTLGDILPDLSSSLEPILHQVVATGESVLDVEISRPDPAIGDADRTWLASGIPFWADGKVAGVSVAVREITDQKRVERQLRELNATLEEQVRTRTEMIAMLHDVASHVHEAATLEGAAAYVLRRVIEHYGWSRGCAWLVAPDSRDRLLPLAVAPEGSLPDVAARSAVTLCAESQATGEPAWLVRSADDAPGTKQAAAQSGVTADDAETAAAFPVAVEGRVELILEFVAEHRVEDDERIRQGMQSVSIHLARTIERLRAEATLRENEQRFRELAEGFNQVFWVLDPTRDEFLYVSPEWARIVGAPRAELPRNAEQWRRHLHPDDRKRVEEEFQAKAPLGLFDVVYRVVRSDGEIRWVHDVAVPIRDAARNVRRILGMALDVTERRELEREIADAATHEQQRLSRDLHDSIGQELTGLTMMAAQHAQALADHAPEDARVAVSLMEGLKRTLQQVRRISRGLAPVDIEAGGLMVALAQLAEQTSLAAMTDCEFRCGAQVTLRDPGVASHLYRIAQEAVSNAVKHAHAGTITISLGATGDFCELTIEDNGRGLPATAERQSDGMGLKTMRYRANLIGAAFQIGSPAAGGTSVRCRVRQDGQVQARR